MPSCSALSPWHCSSPPPAHRAFSSFAPPLTRYDRWRRFALLNWHWPLLLGLGAYIISPYFSERAPGMLIYALSIAGIPVAAYGPPRAALTLFAALAASLIYAWLFMKI